MDLKMKTKNIRFTIKLDDAKGHNKMHFEAQLKNRMQIQEDRTKFKRSRSKSELRKILKEY